MEDFSVMVPFLGLLLGCAMRTLLPYVVTGLELIAKENSFAAWPRFEPSYLSAFVLAVLGYGVTLATSPGAWSAVLLMDFVQAVAYAYTGQSLARLVVKAAVAVSTWIKTSNGS